MLLPIVLYIGLIWGLFGGWVSVLAKLKASLAWYRRLLLRLGLTFVSVSISVNGHAAEPVGEEADSYRLNPVSLEIKREQPSPWGGSLGVHGRSFFRSRGSQYFRPGAEDLQSEISLAVRYARRSGLWTRRLDLRDDFRPGENFHYLKPFEFFVERESGSTLFGLGRRKFNWSESENLWSQGFWQPRYMDDRLSREQAGFLGLYLQWKSHRHSLLLLGSPVFVPDMGPQFRIEGNVIVSENPWFATPVQEVELNGVPTTLRYSFESPDLATIALNSLIAGRYEYETDSGVFVRASYARKPMNQIFLGAPITLSVGTPNFANVDIQVRVLNHEVSTLELGRREVGAWTTWLSGTYERPIRDVTPASWTTQEATAATAVTGYLGRDFGSSGQSHAYFSLWSLTGGDAPDRGDYTAGRSLFDRRFLFQRAAQIGWMASSKLWSSVRPMKIKASALWDDLQRGGMTSLAVEQSFRSGGAVTAALDLMGIVDLSGEVTDGFLARFRANDRFSLGVHRGF